MALLRTLSNSNSINTGYRQHRHPKTPACCTCTRRESRCTVDLPGQSCLYCRLKSAECNFSPPLNASGVLRSRCDYETEAAEQTPSDEVFKRRQKGDAIVPDKPENHSVPSTESVSIATTLGETARQSSHIVAPTVAHDAQVLENHLSPTSTLTDSTRDFRPYLTSKQRVGLSRHKTPGIDECEGIEKLIEPFASELIDIYFKFIALCRLTLVL
ncbi:hypothetical protein BJ546DRAFT_965141 [Cryomyces antarcticus]